MRRRAERACAQVAGLRSARGEKARHGRRVSENRPPTPRGGRARIEGRILAGSDPKGVSGDRVGKKNQAPLRIYEGSDPTGASSIEGKLSEVQPLGYVKKFLF